MGTPKDAYYNEYDPVAAQWLRNLIEAGHIAPGIVDERSILDVCPSDLRGFRQHHFFAGVGVWSRALRGAGWADTRPVWTGSCPCQPFSAAGLGAGFDDERHLWPAFHYLFEQHVIWLRNQKFDLPVIFGEQVASKAVDPWIDLVHADLEAMGYAFGSVPFPSAGVGAPHIRDRNYWVGHPDNEGLERFWRGHQAAGGRVGTLRSVAAAGESCWLADLHGDGCESGCERCAAARHGQAIEPDRGAGRLADASGKGRRDGRQPVGSIDVSVRAAPAERGIGGQGIEGLCVVGGVADADGRDASTERQQRGGQYRQQPQDGRIAFGLADSDGGPISQPVGRAHKRDGHTTADAETGPAGPTNGFWRDADWLGCRDGKWRPVEPGTFPLAHGATGRVGRLRAYGNAINAEQAQIFVECVLGGLDLVTE